MKKCQELATALATEYSEKTKHKRAPQLILSVKDKKGESYHSSYSAGKLSIVADSPLAQAYAISQMSTAFQAHHLAEYLGETCPRFNLRPVWLKAPIETRLTDQLTLHLPEFMLAEDAPLLLPRLCMRLVECGYNSIVIGTYLNTWILNPPASSTVVDLNFIIQQLQEHSIQVILKPNFNSELATLSPYSSEFQSLLHKAIDELFKKYPKIDALFWESLWQTPSYQEGHEALESTDAEIALTEIRYLEKCIQNRSKLIFYMPTPLKTKSESHRWAQWMLPLLDDMGKETLLAFNSVCGSLFDDYSSDNPLWELLRTSPDSSYTPLLPIMNVGLIRQGEGLWPLTNFDLLDRFLPRCRRHHFAGMISLTSHLPQAGSVLDCNLWVAGQTLWRSMPAIWLAETWFKAFRPKENFAFCLQAMHKGRSIILSLTSLSKETLNGEDSKIYGDYLLANLKHLKWLWDKQQEDHSSMRPSIKDHFPFFFRDVKQLLTKFLPTYHFSLSHLVSNEEPETSFWGHTLDEPLRGHKDSTMEAIYLENRYL